MGQAAFRAPPAAHARLSRDLARRREGRRARQEAEPIYGEAYLPRKFKTAFVVPPHNDVDVFANDLGFIAIVENGELQGFNVTVGGGMGASHGDPETYPRIADVIGFCTARAGARGRRGRRHDAARFRQSRGAQAARLKYTIDRIGPRLVRRARSRAVWAMRSNPHGRSSSRRTAIASAGSRASTAAGISRCASKQAASRDTRRGAHLTGLREIAKVHRGDFRLTPNQNLTIANVDPAGRTFIDVARRQVRARPSRARDARGARRAGLCRAADLRSRDGRGGALPAAPDPTRRRAHDRQWRRRRAAGAAHHGLPERLRTALSRRDRVGRQGAGPLQPVSSVATAAASA